MIASKETTQKVKELLSNGFNSVEIAKKLKLHEVTIRKIKLQLKKDYEFIGIGNSPKMERSRVFEDKDKNRIYEKWAVF